MRLPIAMHEIQETTSFNTGAASSQGVCTDGSNIFVTDTNHIYKYSMSGSLVSSVSTGSNGSVHHNASLCIKDGVLYVEVSSFPSTPAVGYIQKYAASNLAYLGEAQTFTDKYGGGIGWDGTNFWVGDNGANFKLFDENLAYVKTVTSDYTPDDLGWQGLAWDGDYLYANSHEGSLPQTVRKFFYDGTSLTLVEHLAHPFQCTQGIDFNAGVIYMARRGSPSDGVVICKIVPYDYSHQNLIERYDAPERQNINTSYTRESILGVTLPVKKDDLIKVTLSGIFRCSSGSLRAYIDPPATGSVGLEAINDGPSLRSDCTTSEGQTTEITKLYRATATGNAEFYMWWRKNTSGTAYASQRNLYAQVIGKTLAI